MATVERQIDALGGVDHMRDALWNEGYSEALTAACEIAQDADALIDELLETILDVLDGRSRSLERWTTEARTLVIRVTHRRAQ